MKTSFFSFLTSPNFIIGRWIVKYCGTKIEIPHGYFELYGRCQLCPLLVVFINIISHLEFSSLDFLIPQGLGESFESAKDSSFFVQ